MSTFDVDLFLNTQQDAGEFATKLSPIPDGEYAARIEEVKGRMAKDSPIMEIFWQLEAVGNESADNRKVRQSIFLDLTSGGSLDKSKDKNIRLGQLLEAFELNGKPWSPASLAGRVARIKVSSRLGEGEHAGKVFSDVKGITKL